MKQKTTVRAAGIEFVFSAETQNQIQPKLSIEVTPSTDLADTHLLRLSIEAPDRRPLILCDLTVEWTIPVSDMHGLYFGGNPRTELTYLPFWEINKQICANTGVPYVSLIHRNGETRAAFVSFDQITETTLTAELSEITR